MASYYVNTTAQSNGDHEVHRADCSWMPENQNRLYLGEFLSCREAVWKAKQYFSQSNGCYHCSRECHTG